MTYGQDYGQPDQYPQQRYGQQEPQDQRPPQYDPSAHQQRIGAGQYAPQGQPWPQQAPQWQQPGYGQPQPSYPPQPGYQPPQPPRRRPWAARHKVLTGFLAFCGLVFVIGIAAAAASPSPSTSSQTPPATQAAAPASPQAAASSAPGAKPAAKTVATFTGNGQENTPKFTVTATWKLAYSFNCADAGGTGNFIVMEDGGFGGAMNVNSLAASKTGSSYAYSDAGTHYLEIDSECDWHLSVIDEG